MSICERIQSLCNEHNITIYRLEKDCGFGNGSVMKWNTSSPKVDNLLKAADYFGVSVDYLLGRASENKDIESYNIERTIIPSSYIPAVFNEMPNLLSEERFINTAKVYYELPDEKREQAYMLICGIAIGLGLNIHDIIGRK